MEIDFATSVGSGHEPSYEYNMVLQGLFSQLNAHLFLI